MPMQPQATAIIADIHHLFLCEEIDNFRVNALQYFPDISQWGFSSCRRSFQAKKENFHRPCVLVGILIVQENTLLRWKISGSINIASDATAGRGTFSIFQQFSGHSRNKFFKLG